MDVSWAQYAQLEIWRALGNVYPEEAEQHCWNHKIMNALDGLPKCQHAQAKLVLRGLSYALARVEAKRLMRVFTRWCGDHSYGLAARRLSVTGKGW